MSNHLAETALQVLQNYDLSPKLDQLKVIQSGGIKTVWKITSNDQVYCLKRLRQTKEKALFSIYAQKHMADQGAHVPKIYTTGDDQAYVEHDGYLFVLYQWIEGQNIRLAQDLKVALEGLAQFHLESAGYTPPSDCRVSSKLGRQQQTYQSILNRFDQWRETAQHASTKSVEQAFLDALNPMYSLGKKSLQFLQDSAYDDWVAEIAHFGNLCHQDYGDGNALLTATGVYVLDLDGVTFDLPSRDLRKIIVKIMTIRKSWDLTLLKDILYWYEQINPLNGAKRRVLLIDLLFPHEFHDVAKNYFKKGKAIPAKDLTYTRSLIQKKAELLLPLFS